MKSLTSPEILLRSLVRAIAREQDELRGAAMGEDELVEKLLPLWKKLVHDHEATGKEKK